MEVFVAKKSKLNYKCKLPETLPNGVKKLCEQWKDVELPEGLIISTITVRCAVDMKFDLIRIVNSLKLEENVIEYIRGMNVFKSITVPKRNKKKQLQSFHNQVSVGVVLPETERILCVKLFLNGSIHITGCKNVNDAITVMNILFSRLHYESLTIKRLTGLKICMINSNFKIGFEIDRVRLYHLIKDNITCSYDPTIHACVDIKYLSDEKKVSIFVFESGSIIITGANKLEQVFEAYNFINKLLLENYKKIVKKEPLTNSIIAMYVS
jgi:TATA-box binding protein (TBP) (component of TFIID and TFIIIB)